MFKKYLSLILLLLLTNCSAPGTALLGPMFTGATTKNVAQTSLSLGTNTIIRQVQKASKESKTQVQKIVKKIENLKFNIPHNSFINFHR